MKAPSTRPVHEPMSARGLDRPPVSALSHAALLAWFMSACGGSSAGIPVTEVERQPDESFCDSPELRSFDHASLSADSSGFRLEHRGGVTVHALEIVQLDVQRFLVKQESASWGLWVDAQGETPLRWNKPFDLAGEMNPMKCAWTESTRSTVKVECPLEPDQAGLSRLEFFSETQQPTVFAWFQDGSGNAIQWTYFNNPYAGEPVKVSLHDLYPGGPQAGQVNPAYRAITGLKDAPLQAQEEDAPIVLTVSE